MISIQHWAKGIHIFTNQSVNKHPWILAASYQWHRERKTQRECERETGGGVWGFMAGRVGWSKSYRVKLGVLNWKSQGITHLTQSEIIQTDVCWQWQDSMTNLTAPMLSCCFFPPQLFIDWWALIINTDWHSLGLSLWCCTFFFFFFWCSENYTVL